MKKLEELSKSEYRDMEKFMNRFAGALLIPREMLLEDLKGGAKLDIRYYIELKKKYRVSAQALIVRANQIGVLTTNQYQYLMRQISQHGYRTNEPLDDAYQIISPRYLKQAMIMIKRDRKVSGNEFMQKLKSMKLSVYSSMVEKILNLEEGFLSDATNVGEILLVVK